MSFKSLLLSTLFLLTACANNTTSMSENSAETLALLMVDTFKTQENNKDKILDRRVLIDASNSESIWLYYQLNTGETNKLYRQRILNLVAQDDGSIEQTAYTPVDLKKWENAWDKPEVLQKFSQQDYKVTFDKTCSQKWKKSDSDAWRGYVDPKVCKIFSSRRQQTIYIEGESFINSEKLMQTERGYNENGQQLWGTQPDVYITLLRQ